MSSDHNIPASTVDQSPSLPSNNRSRSIMHSSAPVPDIDSVTVSTTEMHIADDEIVEELSADEVAIIFGFLSYADIMHARVCTKWREAAKKTTVPQTELVVDSVRSYNAMRAMSTALPNLQEITLSEEEAEEEYKYSDGEDPDGFWVQVTANWTSHDINIISSFRKLSEMSIYEAPLNGIYPAFFDFPLLRVLRIQCYYLKFDLEMLVGLPSLEELDCYGNPHLTGNVSSLRVLRDTLEKVHIIGCERVTGSFMDLADFPRLRELNLYRTRVTGDIRNIRETDFQALEGIRLSKSVCGGVGYAFQRISEVPSSMDAIYLLLGRKPRIVFRGEDLLSRAFYWSLSEQSADWYGIPTICPAPPFFLQIIQAGGRTGWSWCTFDGEISEHSCEINWLDPEPSSESCDYETYVEELQRFKQRTNFEFYSGYHQPPNEHQYRRLCEDRVQGVMRR